MFMRGARRRLSLVALVVIATFVCTQVTGVAGAAVPPPDSTSFCQNVPPDNPFSDVGPGPHHDHILCLAAARITQGTSATTFSPSAPVRRDQMASFISRAIDELTRLQTPDASLRYLPLDDDNDDFFADVDDANVHKRDIGRLFENGIVKGSDETNYNPSGPVTRAQMATFINRSEEFVTGTAFSSATDFFTDDNGNPHEANINGVASVGIAQGETATTYGPDDPVTREQMASFIIRWLALHAEAGDVTPLPADVGPELTGVSATDADQSFGFSKGDPIVLTFANAVAVSSSLVLTDGFGTSVRLSDDQASATTTSATFKLSNGNTTLTVTPTRDVVFNNGTSFGGRVTITDAVGITNASSPETWNPDKEPIESVRFAIS